MWWRRNNLTALRTTVKCHTFPSAEEEGEAARPEEAETHDKRSCVATYGHTMLCSIVKTEEEAEECVLFMQYVETRLLRARGGFLEPIIKVSYVEALRQILASTCSAVVGIFLPNVKCKAPNNDKAHLPGFPITLIKDHHCTTHNGWHRWNIKGNTMHVFNGMKGKGDLPCI